MIQKRCSTARWAALARHHRSNTIQARRADVPMCSWNCSPYRPTWWTAACQQQTLLVICGPPVSGSWLSHATDWTVSVVGVLLLRVRRLGIHCLTVSVTKNLVKALLFHGRSPYLWHCVYSGITWVKPCHACRTSTGVHAIMRDSCDPGLSVLNHGL